MDFPRWKFKLNSAGSILQALSLYPADFVGCNLLVFVHSLLHLECRFISISNLNLLGLFSMERDQRDLES